jgi:hypothetical protein
VRLSPLGTSVILGLLFQSRTIINGRGAVVRLSMGVETETPVEILDCYRFVHFKSHIILPGIEHEPPRWEATSP